MNARTGGMTAALLMLAALADIPACAAEDPAPDQKKPTHTALTKMVGGPLPAFTVMSGDKKFLASKDLTGATTFITYETREVIENNREARAELVRLFNKQYKPGTWRYVAIVDASSANLFTRFVWRRKLRENSRKAGRTIYGDWDGKPAAALKVERNESNFIVVDAGGVIRYFAYGLFGEKERKRQRDLLMRLRPRRKPKRPREGDRDVPARK